MISPPARLFYSGDVMDNTTHGYMPPRLRTKLVCATIETSSTYTCTLRDREWRFWRPNGVEWLTCEDIIPNHFRNLIWTHPDIRRSNSVIRAEPQCRRVALENQMQRWTTYLEEVTVA